MERGSTGAKRTRHAAQRHPRDPSRHGRRRRTAAQIRTAARDPRDTTRSVPRASARAAAARAAPHPSSRRCALHGGCRKWEAGWRVRGGAAAVGRSCHPIDCAAAEREKGVS